MGAAARTLPEREDDWLDELETIAARLDDIPPAARAAVKTTAEAILEQSSHPELGRALRLLDRIGPT